MAVLELPGDLSRDGFGESFTRKEVLGGHFAELASEVGGGGFGRSFFAAVLC